MKPKVAICIPVYITLPDQFFINLVYRLKEIKDNPDFDFEIFTISSQPVDRNRNMLIQEALKTNPDYILFIDSDTIFPALAINELLKMNQPISSGLYFSKRKPYVPMAMNLNKDGTHSVLRTVPINTIIDIDATGLGFCLIKADIFRKIPYPWFEFKWKERNGEKYQVGEDVIFFDKVKILGYSVKLNTSIICDHYGIPLEAEHHINYLKGEIVKGLCENCEGA